MPDLYLDTSTNLAAVAPCLSRAGVTAVGRYYTHKNGSKLLLRHEAQTLIANRIAIWTIFQFLNDSPSWFTYVNGMKDATRALECMRELGQPPSTAIYFAVDFPADLDLYVTNNRPYFAAIHDLYHGGTNLPYLIGVCGDGLICKFLLEEGLVYCAWLSSSSSYPENWNFYQSNKWSLAQKSDALNVCDVPFDTNEVNPHRVIGQFDHLID
jgi:hypothetical protein